MDFAVSKPHGTWGCQVSPMVIRLVSVSDQMPLHEFHDVFRTILGWNGDLGYIVRVYG